MTALAANRNLPNILDDGPGYTLDCPVGAAEEIYIGSFVGADSGDFFAAPVDDGSNVEGFLGISEQRVTGGSSNGDNTVKVRMGFVLQHALASVAMADIGKLAYASDDQTLTLTATTNTLIGRIVNVPVTGTCIIDTRMRDLVNAG